MQIPELQTARLKLRAHTLADFEPLVALWANPAVVAHIGKPSSRTDAWGRLLRYRGHWQLFDYGFWAVEECATGRYLGDVGVAQFHRDIQPTTGDTPETGWVFSPEASGKGYGTEAMQAVLAWADAHLPQGKTCCIIAPENKASVRVAEKLGYRKVGVAMTHGDRVDVFERLRA